MFAMDLEINNPDDRIFLKRPRRVAGARNLTDQCEVPKVIPLSRCELFLGPHLRTRRASREVYFATVIAPGKITYIGCVVSQLFCDTAVPAAAPELSLP